MTICRLHEPRIEPDTAGAIFPIHPKILNYMTVKQIMLQQHATDQCHLLFIHWRRFGLNWLFP